MNVANMKTTYECNILFIKYSLKIQTFELMFMVLYAANEQNICQIQSTRQNDICHRIKYLSPEIKKRSPEIH